MRSLVRVIIALVLSVSMHTYPRHDRATVSMPQQEPIATISACDIAEIVYQSTVLVRKLQTLHDRCMLMMKRLQYMFDQCARQGDALIDSGLSQDFDIVAYFSELKRTITSFDMRVVSMQADVISSAQAFIQAVSESYNSDSYSEIPFSDDDFAYLIDRYQNSFKQAQGALAHDLERVSSLRTAALQEFMHGWLENIKLLSVNELQSSGMKVALDKEHQIAFSSLASQMHSDANECAQTLAQERLKAEQYHHEIDQALQHEMSHRFNSFVQQLDSTSYGVHNRILTCLDALTSRYNTLAEQLREDSMHIAHKNVKDVCDRLHKMARVITDVPVPSYISDASELKRIIDERIGSMSEAYHDKKCTTAECTKNKLLCCVADLHKTGQECVDEINKNGMLLIQAPRDSTQEFLLTTDNVLAKMRDIQFMFKDALYIKVSDALAASRLSYERLLIDMSALEQLVLNTAVSRIEQVINRIQRAGAQIALQQNDDYDDAIKAIDEFFDNAQKSINHCTDELNSMVGDYAREFQTIASDDAIRVADDSAVMAARTCALLTDMRAQSNQAIAQLFSELECLAERQQGDLCEKFSTAQKEMIAAVDRMIVALEKAKGFISESIAVGQENVISDIEKGAKGGMTIAGVMLKYLIHTYEALYVSIFKIFAILLLPV